MNHEQLIKTSCTKLIFVQYNCLKMIHSKNYQMLKEETDESFFSTKANIFHLNYSLKTKRSEQHGNNELATLISKYFRNISQRNHGRKIDRRTHQILI